MQQIILFRPLFHQILLELKEVIEANCIGHFSNLITL
jgi:hypothetical protein